MSVIVNMQFGLGEDMAHINFVLTWSKVKIKSSFAINYAKQFSFKGLNSQPLKAYQGTTKWTAML